MHLEPGYTVDRYAVAAKLGEGGMAVVYRVQHTTLGTCHALKVLTMSSRQVRDRLVQEGRVQAALRHPHIVAVTDVLDLEGAPGLLMEYIDGPALDEWLLKYRPTVPEALILFRALVAGVGHAHGRGLIHRDLKPANVMLQVTDQGLCAKVTDFGLAKLDRDGSLKRTRTGMTMGTPAYMAPEQIEDASSVDRRADLYSLGCILYELVCGRTPYDADNMLKLFVAVAAGKYPHPSTLAPDLPEPVLRCIEGLLATDPAARLQDCAAILEVLDGRSPPPLPDPAAPLAPPRPLGPTGDTVLPLAGPAADVARTMTRGIGQVEAISQAPWTSRHPSTDPGGAAQGPRSAPTLDSTDLNATMATEAGVPRPDRAPSEPPTPRRRLLPVLLVVGLLGVALAGAGVLAVTGLGVLWTRAAPEPPTLPTTPIDREPRRTPDPAPAAADPAPQPADPAPQPVDPAPQPAGPAPQPTPVAPAPVDPAPVAPKPVPVAPKPAPAAPKPAPAAPKPVPAAPTTGSFRFTGATRVEVVDEAGNAWQAGQPVPPGSYRVRVDGRFSGSNVEIAAGAETALECVAAVYRCRKL